MFCGSEDPGIYTAQPRMVTHLGFHLEETYLTPVTFSMRRPTTTTALTASTTRPRVGSRMRFVVRVSDERPAGDGPTDAARVVLQHYRDGLWTRVRHSRDTSNARGRPASGCG